MDLTENLNLIGYSMTESKQLKSIDEVAEFICKQGKHGDVTKPYCLTFLKYVQEYLSEEDFAKTLAECWVRDEQPNINPNFTKTELTSMFRRADKKFLMSEDQLLKVKQKYAEKIKIF